MFLRKKFLKLKKGKIKGKNSNYNSTLLYNSLFGLKTLKNYRIKQKFLENIKNLFLRKFKDKKKIKFKIFANIGITKKPIDVRMGKGKGNIDHWIAKIKMGQIIFEIFDLPLKIALKFLKKIKKKLPFKTKIVYKYYDI